MLIYSEERYVSTEVNMMIIRSKDGEGYYYVHRLLYDQAVILHDLYGSKPEELCYILTGVEGMREDVESFLEEAPAPINILGCFLLLVDGIIDEPLDRVGAIHVMSGPVRFRDIIKWPREIRSTMQFSLSIKEEYELAWDRFFKEAIPFDGSLLAHGGINPLNGTATTVYSSDTGEEINPNEEVDPDALLMSILMCEDDDDPFAIPDDEDEEEESDSGTTEPVADYSNTPVAEEPVVEEPVVPKRKTGLDIIRGWKP